MALTVHALNEPELIEAARAAAEIAYPVFCAQDWTWGWTHPHTPTVEEITKFYLELAGTVIERKSRHIRSGHLQVSGSYGSLESGAPERIAFNLELGEYK